MAIEIAEAVVGALRGELAATAVNAPMVPAEVSLYLYLLIKKKKKKKNHCIFILLMVSGSRILYQLYFRLLEYNVVPPSFTY